MTSRPFGQGGMIDKKEAINGNATLPPATQIARLLYSFRTALKSSKPVTYKLFLNQTVLLFVSHLRALRRRLVPFGHSYRDHQARRPGSSMCPLGFPSRR